MLGAVKALQQQQPARIVVAVPTASPETCEQLRAEVDDVICAITPEPFHAVGLWYQDFSQTMDEEVRELLARRNTPDKSEAKQSSPDAALIELFWMPHPLWAGLWRRAKQFQKQRIA